MRVLGVAIVCCGCVSAEPTNTADPEPTFSAHFEFYGVMPSQAAWYETFVTQFETWRGEVVPPIRLFQDTRPTCPSSNCRDDGRMTVVCSALNGDCMPALVAAINDHDQLMPLAFRNGAIDVLAGGVGHGDLLDFDVDRSVDIASLIDDGAYTAAEQNAEPLEWAHRVGYPAGDFVRFVFDTLGSQSGASALASPSRAELWGSLVDLDSALALWRAQPQTLGRMFRLPLTECATSTISDGQSLVPATTERVLYAPDLLDPMHRTAVANFTVEVAGTVRVSVTSSIHATPFFRVESCGGPDAGLFVASYSEAQGDSVTKAANLPIGHYFVIAGSSGGDSSSDPSAAERPESISISSLGATP